MRKHKLCINKRMDRSSKFDVNIKAHKLVKFIGQVMTRPIILSAASTE